MTFLHLNSHADRLRGAELKTLARRRLAGPRLSAAGWTLDTSRQFLDADAERALVAHAESAGLTEAIADLFNASEVNVSEGRAALHWALRGNRANMPAAASVAQSMQVALALSGALRSGETTGATGKAFRAVVHIGIGGSDFGPRLVADAFADGGAAAIELRFCANLDPLDLDLALQGLDPETTLVVGISKSFGTEETLFNLSRARRWLQNSLGSGWAEHQVLVTARPDRARDWASQEGVVILDLPETVGGRFSIWSAGSLACMIWLGEDVFRAFLAGAADMDAHVQHGALSANLAVRLALLDVWNTSVMGFQARAVLAYSRRLRMLPTYLQQLEMESNGKSVTASGDAVSCATAPLLWGGEGTIGQHSYHQWLHQGTQIVPTEFILAPGSRSDAEGVVRLSAHALAQAEVLANGRSLHDVQASEPDLPPQIAAQKVHPGGRPSTLLLAERLTPERLGALIALYEHRTYLAGRLWGLNSFDQWGVEAGKSMAGLIKPALRGDQPAEDAVTADLVKLLRHQAVGG